MAIKISGTTVIDDSRNLVNTNALTTGNYSSYVPSLTGTGASGTWGISITGNAATVTSITSSQVTTALGYAPGQGTVTSVSLSLPDMFAVSGSPVTGSGHP